MAKGKKSFVLYTDYEKIFEQLTDDEAGRLIKHIFQYVNDKNPDMKDRMLNILFEPIKMQLKRDLQEWRQEKRKRKKSGKLGGIRSGESRRSEANRRSASKNEANEAVNVTVTDTVNVTDNKNIINKEDENIKFPIEHCLMVAMNDERFVEKNKATPEILNGFNDYLEGQGIYNFNPNLYKKYFHNWNKKIVNGHQTTTASDKHRGTGQLTAVVKQNHAAGRKEDY